MSASGFANSVPVVGGLMGQVIGSLEDDGVERKYQDAIDNMSNMQDPHFSQEQLQAQDYNPEMYAAPESAGYQTVAIDPRTRDAQLAALDQLRGVAGGAADAQQRAASYDAMSQASNVAKGREGAIMQDAAARGMTNSGLQYAMREQASQDAANRAQSGTLQAAQMAALQRLQAQNDYIGGMGSVRGQDYTQAAKNSDIINTFNMHNTDARNAAAQGNVDTTNKSRLYNAGNRQDVQKFNLNRGDQNTQQVYSDQLDRNKAVAGDQGDYTGQVLGQLQKTRQEGDDNRKELEKMMGGMMGGG